jgi:glutamate/tyrosine decarboxylase-like PLP-dependent enzyme
MSIEKVAFLGPQAENQEILEKFIDDVLKDYIYWRRNIHPEDSPAITEEDKLQPAFILKNSELKKELFKILSELKKGAPTFSKRYFGHLLSDLFIPSIVGYFAAMLYNQNNVVAEVSPVTTNKELEYMREISKMFSYPEMDNTKLSTAPSTTSWGHLSSGGTSANLEAMWVARNIKFYPLSVKLLTKKKSGFSELEELEISLPNGETSKLKELDPFQLLMLNTKDVLNLNLKIISNYDDDKKKSFEREITSIQKMGFINFYKECADKENGLDFELPKIIIPQTVHYCWYKSMDILGLGNDNLIQIPVDLDFRMNIEILRDQIQNAIAKRNPMLALIGICGTTEEGAIDPLNQMVEIKKDFEKDGISFWLHSDAAIGGYFASLLKDENFKDIEIQKYSDIKALKNFDSIVIDPHKFGYVPYPAGAVIFKDSRIREHITYEAPYLNESEDITKTFLGKWTLEGSRPGAAAVSCYLAQHSFPLHNQGHGLILNQCLKITDQLMKSFDAINSNKELNKGFQIIPLYEPQLDILCYTVASPEHIKTPDCINKLTNGIYKKLSITGDHHANHYEYIISKTEYPIEKYKNIIKNYLTKCDILEELPKDYRLTVLRSVMMNPLVNDEKILNRFAQHLCNVAYELLPYIQIDRILKIFNGRRMKILIAEDQKDHRESLRHQLEFDQTISKGIEVYSISDTNQKYEYDPHVIISDIDFDGHPSKGIEFIDKHKNKNILVYSAYLDTKANKDSLDDIGIPMKHRIKKSTNFENDSRDIFNTIMTSFIN